MTNRRNLYGYHIENDELAIVSQEAEIVQRIAMLYIAGGSYQSIAETLNNIHIPFSAEAPLWNKHKMKRLLENPRYTGQKGYPAIIDAEAFQAVQRMIREKTAGYAPTKDRPTEQTYAPSGEVIRLTNVIDRGLEHPDKPEDIMSLILQGASARYDCCPAPTGSEPFSRPAEADFKRFGQAVSHFTITDGTITVHFK